MNSWLGLKNLLVEAVHGTTALMEETQKTTTTRIYGLLKKVPGLTHKVKTIQQIEGLGSAMVYGHIRFVNRLVSTGLDKVLPLAGILRVTDQPQATPMRSDEMGSMPWLRDSAISALNGIFGDSLKQMDNQLAEDMTLRHNGEVLRFDHRKMMEQLAAEGDELCIFVHGLACTEWSWNLSSEEHYGTPETNYGTLLRDELGLSCLYLRYNTGLHISENGHALATLISDLYHHYPRPIKRLILVGHSMGGLVSRSACHYGAIQNHPWTDRVTQVVCLGSPHLGAPLEKAGHLLTGILRRIELPSTQIPARIIDGRSAGIKDLRFGYVVHEDWIGKDPDALFQDHRTNISFLPKARYHYVASTVSKEPTHPLGRVMGDWLVRLHSASGNDADQNRKVPFEEENGVILGGVNHIQLANHPEVYRHLLKWCRNHDHETVTDQTP